MNSNNNAIGKFFADFKKYLPLLKNLAVKDIKIKYRRSVLGIAWSVLNPLLTMLVLTTVFKMLLRITVENFATYYILGASLWNFFAEASTLSLASITGSASLIKKVYVPKYMFTLEKCIFALINYAFGLIAVVLVMMIQGVYPNFTAFFALYPIVCCFIFCCGLSLILGALTVYFRDIAHFYSVILTLWMYLTPILYPTELLMDKKLVYYVVCCNPMYYYVESLRDSVMYHTIPSLQNSLLCAGFAVVFLALGVLIFKKCEGKFILHI